MLFVLKTKLLRFTLQDVQHLSMLRKYGRVTETSRKFRSNSCVCEKSTLQYMVSYGHCSLIKIVLIRETNICSQTTLFLSLPAPASPPKILPAMFIRDIVGTDVAK